MNIIIPIGGMGERFKKENYNRPKPLINIFGKPMIFNVIDNLLFTENDNLIIIYNQELNNYNFSGILKKKYKNIILIELTKQTEGAAETVLIGLNTLDDNILNKKCVILDCDTFYKYDILSIFRNQEENAIFCFKDIQENPIYSYIEFNDQFLISDIKEKIKISDYANSGCYCFKNGYIIKQYCTKIILNNLKEKNEYYISVAINEMLLDKHKFIANIIDYDKIICVGTPLQLQIYCSNNNHSYIHEKKRFCFDLDNTLVTAPCIYNDYTTVLPIVKNIEFLKNLKKFGHYIIIYTARRMKTHNSNIGKIMQDIGKITLDTLENFKIPYDELYFGKPYADFYIDDLAINIYDDLEKQLGFYQTSVPERTFNEIKDDKIDIIIKKSNDNKLKGEIFFYKNMPEQIKKYFPLFIDSGDNWYKIEKIKGVTLSYLYTNELLTENILLNYLTIINDIHNIKINRECITSLIYDNYVNKIKYRYEKYDYSQYKDYKLIYNKLINYFKEYELNDNGICGIIHGDPVFSNSIINSNNDIKLIDMKGRNNTELTIYGDIFYDYAKIYQSLIGYDEIILNKIISNNYKKKLITVYEKFIINKFNEDKLNIIKMITNSLLFSLIPLHNNHNCKKFYSLINL